VTLTGHKLDVDLEPGSPEWLQTVSASQIATIVGLSKWNSPHTLWHLKNGTRPPEKQTAVQERGHEFEPLIFGWFRDANPGRRVVETGTWQHSIRTWQTANPDGLVDDDEGLEIKTAEDIYDWHENIPPYYQVQGQWQMDTIGLKRITFAVCGPFELFHRKPKYFVLEYDPRRAAWLREEALRFLESIDLGIEPDRDLSREDDRMTMRWQHTEIREEGLEIPDELAIPYLTALSDTKRIEGEKARWAAEIAAYLQDRKKATWRGTTLGTRRRTEPPSFSAAKGLADQAPELLNPTPKAGTAA
jgi:putative phage-type endonuclease